ncbi:hypothetical protein ED312_23105 [Sinomicrobium pectinilyticum]|uniref:Uncharacterized protein n=2 Tax=Sinomicrobium pectinilyticum TaxID=1084421 RepID=A0A3N0CYX0_SINP1|nr:hypothetical protein ED312_23105 [Sinomicrobium pectinilyticum]
MGIPQVGGIKNISGVFSLAAKGNSQIWTSTSKLSSVKNAFRHWKKHGVEFPEFLNANNM